MQKARRIRKETGDSRYFAPLEEQENESFGKQVNRIVARPFKVLFQEPMLIAISLYMSVRLLHWDMFCEIETYIFVVVRLRMHLSLVRGVPHRVRRRPSYVHWIPGPHVLAHLLRRHLWCHYRK